MADNKELQQEELEVLKSIYGDELKETQNEVLHCFTITIQIHENLSPLSFQFWYNDSYPSNAPPHFTLKASWLNGEHLSKVTQQLHSLFEKNNVVIFTWVEWLRSNLCSFLQIDTNIVTSKPQQPIQQENSKKSNITIHHSKPFTINKSKFIAHAATVKSVNDVNDVIAELYRDKKIENATHNMYAYRIQGENGIIENSNDDGETGASQNLLFLLQRGNVVNCLIVVSRWYGGIKLGSARFKIIVNVAKELLQDLKILAKK